jgi:hypothetical protein
MGKSMATPQRTIVSVFEAAPASARVHPANNAGGVKVDIALKLNVLAICAVFAFVGAILLGLF